MNRTQKITGAVILGVATLVGAVFGLMHLRSQAKYADISQKIVLVEIDDSTLKDMGPLPFDRSLHATVIDRLRQAGAELVIYNIMFHPKGDDDASIVEALNKNGPPVVFPRINKKQEFIAAPNVHYGQAVAQRKMPEAFLLRDPSSPNLHAVAIASCLVLRLDKCSPAESSVTLTAPSQPFVRIRFQDLLKPASTLETQFQNKLVIVGGAAERPLSTQSPLTTRVSDPEVMGQALTTLLLAR